jgi:hypothetical protein
MLASLAQQKRAIYQHGSWRLLCDGDRRNRQSRANHE